MIEQMVMALTPLALVLAGYWLGVLVSKEDSDDE